MASKSKSRKKKSAVQPVKTELMTLTKIIKEFTKSSIPLIVSGFVSSAEELIHTCMITRLGESALATDVMFDSSIDFFLDTNTALLDPITAMVGQSFGKKDVEEIGRIVQQGWFLAAGLSIPAMIGFCSTGPILRLFGQPEELVSMVEPYVNAGCLAIPPFLSLAVDRSLLKATNKEANLMLVNVGTVAASVGVAYVLMFGKLGFPKLGVTGVGYAFTAQCWLTFSAFKSYLYMNKDFKGYKLFQFDFKRLNHAKKAIELGLPLYSLTLGRMGANFVLTAMSGWYGIEPVAISKAVSIYLRFLREPGNRIGQASQVFVAQYKGAEDYSNLRRFGNMGVIISAGVNVVPFLLFCTYPTQLASLFIGEENLEKHDEFIRMIFIAKALTQFLESIQEVFSENLKGLFDTFYPCVLQLLSTLAVVLPSSYILGYIYNGGLVGMEISSAMGAGLTLPLLLQNWKLSSQGVNRNSKELVVEDTKPTGMFTAYNSLQNRARKTSQETDNLNTPILENSEKVRIIKAKVA